MNILNIIKEVYNFIYVNWAIIATALLAISEVLSVSPKIKSNGIFQAIVNWLKSHKTTPTI